MEFHTDGPWILNIPTNCHKILNNSGKETFKVLKNYHQRRMTWNLKNIMFTKRHLMLFILQSWRWPWHQLLHNQVQGVPKVTVEVNPVWSHLPQVGKMWVGVRCWMLAVWPCASLASSLQWWSWIIQLLEHLWLCQIWVVFQASASQKHLILKSQETLYNTGARNSPEYWERFVLRLLLESSSWKEWP